VISSSNSSSSTANESENTGFIFKARIWRQPGKSIASSATAFLHSSSVIHELPAAPGMVSHIGQGGGGGGGINIKGHEKEECLESESNKPKEQPQIMIHCYSPVTDEYTVSYHVHGNNNDDTEKTHVDLIAMLSKDNDDDDDDDDDQGPADSNKVQEQTIFYLKSGQVAKAKCAKFYPLIDDLICRGTEAGAMAESVIRKNPKLQNLTGSVDIANDETLSTSITKVVQVTDKVTGKLKEVLSDSKEVDGIYKMLKDEDLEVLLRDGRDRLRYLVSGGLTESTKNVLRDMGLEVTNDNGGETMTWAMTKAQEKALAALDELLEDNFDVGLENAQKVMGDKFVEMFDLVSKATNSDGTLEKILEEIREKTSEWQVQTGRLLSTKSSSIFLEGAKRFQDRVGSLLTSPKNQFSLLEKSGGGLTKAFTEGDIALAKLKSIELGESVRSRLFAAIELRSETRGGLDSIIAGAVSQLGGESVGNMLTSFQSQASDSSKRARESLISLLGERSQYREIAIKRIEQVLLDIDLYLGDDLSPDKIVSMVRGEGGTAALFDPIANKAAKEIEKQLDAVEGAIEDKTMLSVVSRVRSIMSGKMTLSSLVDDITAILDQDEVVKAGTSLVQTGEQILDVIEGASDNDTFNQMLGVAEKAGITKETVLDQIGNINIDSVLDTASEAVADERKRLELLSSATDSALEFLLKILPSMSVPPFEGVRDGLIFSIKNLSMHGFKLKKEDIMVEIAGIRAAGQNHSLTDESSHFVQRKVKASDILVLDVRNISAMFDNALWAFEQTYMPYLKGSGRANIKVSEGQIRLEFELKKRKRNSSEDKPWEPVLCLKTRYCTIDQLSISFEGASRLAWVANKLAKMLKKPLRDYVVKIIVELLGTRSGWLLESLNGILSAHWDIIIKTTGLNIGHLDTVNESDIVAAINDPATNEIDLVWTEFVPLGINLLLSDKSGKIKVVDFPRGSQARKVAIDRDLDPDDFKGATIAAVNGTSCANKERVDILLALRDPSRPKTIKFILTPKSESLESSPAFGGSNTATHGSVDPPPLHTIQITEEGPVGITFSKLPDNSGLIINELSEKLRQTHADSVFPGFILTHVNDVSVISEDDNSVENVYSLLEQVGNVRPLSLRFCSSYLHSLSFETRDNHGDPLIGGPNEIVMEERNVDGISKICIKDFNEVDGSVESRGIFLGDHLIFINGNPVGTGMTTKDETSQLKLSQIKRVLTDSSSYPLCLTFARPCSKSRNAEFDVDSTETKNLSVIVIDPRQLGFDLGEGSKPNHYIVKKFYPVRGSLQLKIEESVGRKVCRGLSIVSINGEKVPSYANCSIVMNAMKRSWTRKNHLELVLCDEDKKQSILQLK